MNTVKNDNSEIILHRDGGTTIVGSDAMLWYKAIHLLKALKLYSKHKIQVTRIATPTLMLRAAGEVTKSTYKRGQYAQAIRDLEVWVATMRAALPVTDNTRDTP